MRFILLIFTFLAWLPCQASIYKMKALFNEGKVKKLAVMIDTLQTADDAVVACKSYYKAKLKKNPTETKRLLMDVSRYFPKTEYGQCALLELGIIEFLMRNYDKSIHYLNAISVDLAEKEFWLAKNYDAQKKHKKTIIHSQNYIQNASDYTKIEIAYLIIAEAYAKQKKWEFAKKTIESLKNSTLQKNQDPLILFKLGYYNEQLGAYNSALMIYQNLIATYPYHQYAFQAEEQLYSLEKNKKVEADLKPISAAPIKSVDVSKPSNSISDDEKRMQLYLQTGAFSTQKNAKNLQKMIFKAGYSSIIFPKLAGGRELQVVAAGPFQTRNEARSAQSKLKNMKINSFIIKRY